MLRIPVLMESVRESSGMWNGKWQENPNLTPIALSHTNRCISLIYLSYPLLNSIPTQGTTAISGLFVSEWGMQKKKGLFGDEWIRQTRILVSRTREKSCVYHLPLFIIRIILRS